MARIYHNEDENRNGDFIFEKRSSGNIIDVFYIPSLEKFEEARINPDKAHEYRVKLLEIDNVNGRLTILPINTLGGHDDFLKPKYEKVKRITLADAKPVLSVVDDDPSCSNNFERSLTFGSTVPLDQDINEENIADTPTSKDYIIEVLEDLPPAFTKDYDYGLGLAKP